MFYNKTKNIRFNQYKFGVKGECAMKKTDRRFGGPFLSALTRAFRFFTSDYVVFLSHLFQL